MAILFRNWVDQVRASTPNNFRTIRTIKQVVREYGRDAAAGSASAAVIEASGYEFNRSLRADEDDLQYLFGDYQPSQWPPGLRPPPAPP